MLFYEKSNQKDKIVSILKEADEVIALSAEWKKKFDETFGLKNCVVLENGIDTERLKPAITSVKDHPWKNPKSVFYIRTMLIPKEGCEFIVADFSAIEARVLAWEAGEQWVLDAF